MAMRDKLLVEEPSTTEAMPPLLCLTRLLTPIKGQQLGQ